MQSRPFPWMQKRVDLAVVMDTCPRLLVLSPACVQVVVRPLACWAPPFVCPKPGLHPGGRAAPRVLGACVKAALFSSVKQT